MNHEKVSVIGKLNKVEYNQLTVLDTFLIDEPAGRYTEVLEHRNSARGHLIALEKKGAQECYLGEMILVTTMKVKKGVWIISLF